MKVVDLFCGIGGLSHGLKLEGLDIVAGIDNDKSCKFAFEKNNRAKFIGKDIARFHAVIWPAMLMAAATYTDCSCFSNFRYSRMEMACAGSMQNTVHAASAAMRSADRFKFIPPQKLGMDL